MIRIKKLKVQNVKKGLGKFLRRVGGNAFFAYLALLLIALVFASIVFYRYAFTIQSLEFQQVESQSEFRDDIFQKILQEWEGRVTNSKQAAGAVYPNLFSPSSLFLENAETKESTEETTEKPSE